MLLASSLRDAAARSPYKPGVLLDDRRLTYGEFHREVRHLASKFIAAGVKPGDRVALHLQNGPELAIAYYACFSAGAVAGRSTRE